MITVKCKNCSTEIAWLPPKPVENMEIGCPKCATKHKISIDQNGNLQLSD